MRIVSVLIIMLLALTSAKAQPFYFDPYDDARAAQWRWAPPNVWRAPFDAYAYAPLPPPGPPVDNGHVGELPAPPPPSPMGWVYGPYTSADSSGVVRVAVGADGLNVRSTPDGFPFAALANGVPLIVLQQAGNWILIAPACPLTPTYTWSVTAGGIPLSVCF